MEFLKAKGKTDDKLKKIRGYWLMQLAMLSKHVKDDFGLKGIDMGKLRSPYQERITDLRNDLSHDKRYLELLDFRRATNNEKVKSPSSITDIISFAIHLINAIYDRVNGQQPSETMGS